MIKTFSYSDDNNEFLDMEQNNYFFEGEDCKVLFFSADKIFLDKLLVPKVAYLEHFMSFPPATPTM